MNKKLLMSCLGLMMSAMSFAQWTEPTIDQFFTADSYAKEFKVSEAGVDTTVYYLYNIEAQGFLSNNTCSAHAQWATHAALKTTGNKVIVEKYIPATTYTYDTTYVDESKTEIARIDTTATTYPWDGKTYTISDWYNSRYRQIFPTSWSAMFVDYASQANHMWDIINQGGGVFYIKASAVNPELNDDSIARYFGLDSYDSYLAFNALDADYLNDPTVMPLYPMLDPTLGDKVDIEGTTLLNLMDGVEAMYKWAFIPEETYNKYSDAITAYNYAPTFLAFIEDVEANYRMLNTDAARAVYNNYNVSTYAEMKAAEEALNEQIQKYKISLLDGATRENPVDATMLITNPTFDVVNDFTGWSGTAFGAGGTTSTCAEHYNKTFDTYQDLGILPAGLYRLSVQGYYRRGSASNDYALETSVNPDSMRYAIFYAVIGENDTVSVPLVSASSGAVATSLGGGTSTVGGLIIPNTMESGNYWFQAGYYQNVLNILINEDATMRIGVKKDSLITNDWTLVDNFELTYYGEIQGDPEYVILQNLIDKYDALYPNEDDVKANAEVKSTYFEVLDAAKNATENFTEAGEALTEAATALAASVAEYKTLNSLITRCTTEMERFDGTTFAGLSDQYNDLLMVLEDGYNEGNAEEVLTELEIGDKTFSTTIAELSDLMDKLIIDYITENVHPGDEITLLINNPDFEKNFSGWTITGTSPVWGGLNSSSGGQGVNSIEHEDYTLDIVNVNGNAERWHAAFSMSQVVKNLPKGSYTLTVQGFERNDAYNTGNLYNYTVENPYAGLTAVLYCNEFEQRLHNIMAFAQPEQVYLGSDLSDVETDMGWIPNGMTGSNFFFNLKEDRSTYENKINFVLTEDGNDITIGLKTTSSNTWIIFDNFRLWYNGNEKEVYTELANEIIEKLQAVAETEAGNDAKEQAAAKVDDITDALENDAKTADDLLAAIAEGNAAILYANESAELYKTLKDVNDDLSITAEEYAEVTSPATLDEALGLVDEIADALDLLDKTNEEVQALIDEATRLTSELKIPDYSNASPDNPSDFTAAFITNPTFDTIGDFTGWSGTAFGAGGNTSTNAEHYEKAYDSYQNLNGLPAGYYVVYVQGYYRHGSASTDYSKYTAEDHSADRQAYLYAYSTTDSVETEIAYASSAAVPDGQPWILDGTSAVGDGLVIPNFMTTATNWFEQLAETPDNKYTDKAYYNNLVQVYVGEDGKLRIGVKKDGYDSTDWSIFDNFALFYIGAEPDETLSTGIKAIETATGTTAVALDGIYNLQGQKLAAPVKGINIIGGKKVLVK